MERDIERQPAPGRPQVRSKRWNVSLVWIVPIIALLIGASLVVRSWMQEGPVITIAFNTGEGLVAHKTQVKYRNVVIGEVESVELANDKKNVIAKVKLSKDAESFATEGAQYWVVRPRIGAGGITGVDTLLSGNFIGADAGQSTKPAKKFTGLESPPPITYGEKGKRFVLKAKDLGSLDIGSSIYFRKIPVGQVVSYALQEDGKGVDIGVFIQAPNDAFVTRETRFWNASGIDVDLGANGLKVNTESLSSLLVGGLVFGEPESIIDAPPAEDQQSFELYADRDTALAPPLGKSQFLRMRFDQSMRGLAVGAPVEFMGVEFGKVTSVQLDFDAQKQSFPIMVDAVVYPQRLGPVYLKMFKLLKRPPGDDDAASHLIGSFVEHGLRAQARTGNLLTGQLFVSLDFYPDAQKAPFDATERPIRIPTVPGSLDKLQEQLQQVVARLSKLPIESIANNLDANLRELQVSLKQFNGKTLPGISRTLDEVRTTLKSANSTLSEDSPQREQLTDTLNELERMSRSLRDLSDFLGRHPESLIRGRPKSVDAQDLRP